MEIQTITVAAEYCFGSNPLRLENLGRVNFVFAPNGSGKTTITNALSEQPADPAQRTSWRVAPTDLRIRVFNEAYRSNVLAEHVGGIFTMGQESKEVNDQIAELENAVRGRVAKREEWRLAIGSDDEADGQSGLLGEIAQERNRVRDAVFDAHKGAPETALEAIFKGFRGDKEKFLAETLKRYKPDQIGSSSSSWEQLEVRAQSLAGNKEPRSKLPEISVESLIGAEEVEEVARAAGAGGQGEFAELIRHLGNEDWVSHGRRYVPEAEGKCPFCQAGAPPDLENRLAEYFAGGYDTALERATEIYNKVDAGARQLESEISMLEAALESDPEVDSDPFLAAISGARNAAELLLSQLRQKCEHPTQSFQGADVEEPVRELIACIRAENGRISEHNRVVADRKSERDKLVADGWDFFVSGPNVHDTVKRFIAIERQKNSQIEDLVARRRDSQEQDRLAQEEISNLRSSISNTTEVADKINKLLAAMGFHRFSLAIADSITGGYQIVREDGTVAVDTLSEGERSFICFAYFWESLSGSAVSGGQREDVVAVIDDPISSLDSDSLFIVAAYIRDAAMDVTCGLSNIRQLIVLTHNTQFHHEAAFTSRPPKIRDRHYFRLLKGLDGYTGVEDDGNSSKIRGTYPLLWETVCESARSRDDSASVHVGVVNVVRRIVEGYFKTIGHVQDYQRPPGLSPANQRMISMFHIWASSGSHTIADDIDQTIDTGGTKQFLMMFQRYFELAGHSSHFEMMVRGCGGDDLLAPGGIFASSV